MLIGDPRNYFRLSVRHPFQVATGSSDIPASTAVYPEHPIPTIAVLNYLPTPHISHVSHISPIFSISPLPTYIIFTDTGYHIKATV